MSLSCLRSAPRLRPLLRVALAALLLSLTAPVLGEDATEVSVLTEQLASPDFRVRVQAALLLGKTNDGRAVMALTKRLADESVAVRAASAAALATLGDPVALPSLRRAEGEPNPAAKRQILAAIEKLELREREALTERRSARILVQLGAAQWSLPGSRAEAVGAATQASRRALGRMDDVALLNPTEDAGVVSKRHKRPAVHVQPAIRGLSMVARGDEMVASAEVEFLVQRVPELAIAGKLSGTASATASAVTPAERAALEQEALAAAVESALRTSEAALVAAAGG